MLFWSTKPYHPLFLGGILPSLASCLVFPTMVCLPVGLSWWVGPDILLDVTLAIPPPLSPLGDSSSTSSTPATPATPNEPKDTFVKKLTQLLPNNMPAIKDILVLSF
jgi:hypothetical protein